jgi:4-hydroxythreonine-4-phosphate dehydrogenase
MVLGGDPAGIGPELIAKLLAQESVRRAAGILLIADANEVAEGIRIADCEFPCTMIDSLDTFSFAGIPAKS